MPTRLQVLIPIGIAAVIVGVAGIISMPSEIKIDANSNFLMGIIKLDDKTLEITIDSPKTYFLAKLTYPTAFVLSKNYMESQGDNWIDKPVGTGPFILQEYQIGQILKLKRNDLYWF